LSPALGGGLLYEKLLDRGDRSGVWRLTTNEAAGVQKLELAERRIVKSEIAR
jgi:hypothetical protein